MHRIRRQILELELPREAGALALQQRAGRVFQERVLPQLEAIFDRIAPPGRFVRIERLEVELGLLPESEWERSFVEACVRQIVRQVEESVFLLSDQEEPTAEVLAPEQRAMEVFRHFLETGVLPWYAKGMAIRALETLLAPMFEQHGFAGNEDIRVFLRQKPNVLQRLAWQFSPAFSEKVVERVLELPSGWIRALETALVQKAGLPAPAIRSARLYRALFQLEGSEWRQADPAVLALGQSAAALVFEAILLGKPLPSAANPLTDARKPTKPAQGPSETDAHPKRGQAAPLPKPLERPQRPLLMEEAPSEVLRPPSDQVERPKKKQAPVNPDVFQGLAVENAGLSLLGPYLPTFLGHLQLVENNAFVSEASQTKAVHLLHFLASGQENPEEPALLLPKILCGMLIEDPVPMDLNLTETEREESVALLEAVVRNWPALKNTSPDGLRGAFLQRKGQIAWQDARQCWLLQVERQSQDLLLDRLPWTISVVKLPWMEGVLAVEW